MLGWDTGTQQCPRLFHANTERSGRLIFLFGSKYELREDAVSFLAVLESIRRRRKILLPGKFKLRKRSPGLDL